MNFRAFFKTLTEARRGDFPKQTVVDILSRYKDRKDVLISFRNHVVFMDKKRKTVNNDPGVGINPRNTFDTPTGIYGYVLAPMWENNFKNKNFPFASERPIIVVYEPADGYKAIRSSDFTADELKEKLELLKKVVSYTDDDIKNIIDALGENYKSTPFRTLWSVVRQISMNEIQKRKQEYEKQGKEIQFLASCHHCSYWSNLMIKIGCPIFIDDAGSSTIHGNEPIQSVVFGRKYIKVLERIENKNWLNVGDSSFNTIVSNIRKAFSKKVYPAELYGWDESKNIYINDCSGSYADIPYYVTAKTWKQIYDYAVEEGI